MTIPNPYIEYTTNGTETNFTFPFELLKNTDLTVWFTAEGAPFDEHGDIINNYVVTINTPPALGGNIVVTPAPANNGTLVLRRTMVVELDTSFASVQAITGTQLDKVFNRISLLLQEAFFNSDYLALHYPDNAPGIENESTLVQVLKEGQMWKKVNDKIVGVTISENPDWSTLRSELASATEGGDGASIVGYYDSVYAPPVTTVDAMLTQLATKIQNLENASFTTGFIMYCIKLPASGWVELDDTSIGNTASTAPHAGAEYEDLFTFIWENIQQAYCRVLNASGSPVARGASAAADWAANRRIELPKGAGRPVAAKAVANSSLETPFTVNGNYIKPTQASGIATERFVSGQPVKFDTDGALPTPLNTVDTFYINVYDATQLQIAASVDDFSAGTFVTLSGGSGNHTIILPSQAANSVGSYGGAQEIVQKGTQVGHHSHEIEFHTENFSSSTTPIENMIEPGAPNSPTTDSTTTEAMPNVPYTLYMIGAIKL